jgi:hypothetical protein
MKAVVLAAGAAGSFPKDAKPKCLHHYRHRVVLDYAIESLLEAGVYDIRIVVGYQQDRIRDYAAARNWRVEFAVNERWATDSVSSLETGLAGFDDEALIVCADLIIGPEIIRAFRLTNPARLAWIRSIVPWGVSGGGMVFDEIYRGDIDNSILRIPRHLLNIFADSRPRADRFLARYPWSTPTGPGTGVYFGAAITETFWEQRPIEEVVIGRPIMDIDSYAQTDEGKLAEFVRQRKAL